MPNKHDGKGYRRLMRINPLFYAAWVLIVQVASKCPIRGTLADEDGPLTVEDLSIKTDMPEDVFKQALPVLTDTVQWLEEIDSDGNIISEDLLKSPKISEKIMPELHNKELHGKNTNGASAPHCPHREIISLYNEILFELNPQPVESWNGTPQSHLRDRWKENQERQDLAWWRTFFSWIRDDMPFLMGRTSDWKADLEWLVGPRNFKKVLNGRYRSNGAHKKTKAELQEEERERINREVLEQRARERAEKEARNES